MLLLLAAPLVLPPLSPRPSLSSRPSAQESPLAALPARWEELREVLHVPGLAVAVVRDGEVALLETFGERDPVAKEPVTPDTTFYIASITKTYVALALVSLAAEGALDLDAPVSDCLPRFELSDPELRASLTVRDLLSHARGLQCTPCVLLDAYTGEITEDRYYAHLREAPQPGEPEYTNVNFTLAGRVIEAVTGHPWRDELVTRLFEPLGLTRTTGYADTMYARDDVALPCQWTGEGYVHDPVRKTDRTMHAAGGLGTSARDAARYLIAMTSGGEVDGREIVPFDALEEMLELRTRAARTQDRRRLDGFGLGWMLGHWLRVPLAQHGGGYSGAAALFSFLPTQGIGVAVLANTDGTGHLLCDAVTEDVFAALLGEELLPYEGSALQASARQEEDPGAESEEAGRNPARVAGALGLAPGRYVGRYESELWGTLRVALVEGLLTLRLGDLPGGLVAGERTDAFRTTGGLGGEAGCFEVVDGAVVAAVIELGPGDAAVRFERR